MNGFNSFAYYSDLREEKIVRKRRQMSGRTDLGIENRNKIDICIIRFIEDEMNS